MRRAFDGRGLRLLVVGERVEATIWRQHIDTPTRETRTALFERYQSFALRLAREEWRRTGGQGCEQSDFDQFAIEGLLQAIDRFDALRAARFESYARHRIRGCILNGLSKASEASSQFGYRKRLERERLRSLRATTDGSVSELDQLADLTVKIALGALLEQVPVDPDEVASEGPSAFDTLAWNQLNSEIDKRFSHLPDKEAFVLDQHYRHGLQFQQIAELLGLSKGRVSQIHAKAIERLRRYLSHQR